jgi:hypothetical protein
MTPFIWLVATLLILSSGVPPLLSYYYPHMGSLIHDFFQRTPARPDQLSVGECRHNCHENR